jgi:hypothetical protein
MVDKMWETGLGHRASFIASAAAAPPLAIAAVAPVPRPATPTTKRDIIMKGHQKTTCLLCLLLYSKVPPKKGTNQNLSYYQKDPALC